MSRRDRKPHWTMVTHYDDLRGHAAIFRLTNGSTLMIDEHSDQAVVFPLVGAPAIATIDQLADLVDRRLAAAHKEGEG